MSRAMAAAANVGNGSLFGGPTTIQSDNTFKQDRRQQQHVHQRQGPRIGLLGYFGPVAW